MKFIILLSALFIFFQLQAQVIPNTNDPNAGSIIWFTTYTLTKNGLLGNHADNYQAMILKNPLGEKYLVVVNSSDWLKGTKTRPAFLPLYETPGYPAHVVLDFEHYKFKFYPWNAKDFSGDPHHIDSELNFIGNDHKPHSISFSEFVGR